MGCGTCWVVVKVAAFEVMPRTRRSPQRVSANFSIASLMSCPFADSSMINSCFTPPSVDDWEKSTGMIFTMMFTWFRV